MEHFVSSEYVNIVCAHWTYQNTIDGQNNHQKEVKKIRFPILNISIDSLNKKKTPTDQLALLYIFPKT